MISDRLGISLGELPANADLREDLNAEELEIADLLTTLEKELDVPLSPDEAKRMKTVGDVLDFFEE